MEKKWTLNYLEQIKNIPPIFFKDNNHYVDPRNKWLAEERNRKLKEFGLIK